MATAIAQVASDFSDRLKTVFRLRCIDKNKLAKKLQVGLSTVYSWTYGKSISRLMFRELARELGRESERYLTGKSNKLPTPVRS